MQSSKILIKDSISSEINIHLLPVNIQHNGRAKVNKFFKIEEDSELLLNGKPTVKAKFRGRQFRGAQQQIPEGYKGFLFREDEHQRDEEEKEVEQNKNWNNVGNFSQFTYWMREDVPSQGDTIQRWLNWLPLAKAIHSPLSHEILNQESQIKTEDQSSAKRKIEIIQDDNDSNQGTDKKIKIENPSK